MTVRELWNRMLALGLAIVPVCGLVAMAIFWLYDAHVVLSAEAAKTRLTLSTYETLLDRRVELEAAVARSSHATRNYFWPASIETGVEPLEQQLRTVIETAGGRVQSLEPLGNARQGDYEAVTFRMTVDASATELLETLYALESNRPYLFIDQLHIRVLQERAIGRPEAVLHATFNVRGYVEQ